MRGLLVVLSALLSVWVSSVRGQVCGAWVSTGGLPGVGSTYGGNVKSMTVWDPDGDGPRHAVLVVAGDFHIAGDETVGGIAVWDGQHWAPLPPLTNGYGTERVITLRGDLIRQIGGRIERWANGTWTIIGAVSSGQISAMIEAAGDLWLLGSFTSVGGVAAPGIAWWDGHTWRAPDAGPGWIVKAITAHYDRIVAAGVSCSGCDLPLPRAAIWDGTQWTPMLSGLEETHGDIRALASVNGTLWASGSVRFADGGPPSAAPASLIRFDGGRWESVVAGVHFYPRLLIDRGNELWGVGAFGVPGNQTPFAAVRFTGSEWEPAEVLRPSMGECAAVFQDRLIVGGHLHLAEGRHALGCAQWDGQHWLPLGRGIGRPVTAITEWAGDLVVAAGERTYRRVGSDWLPLGQAVGSTISGLSDFRGVLHAGGEGVRIPPSNRAAGVLRLAPQGWEALSPATVYSRPVMVVRDDVLLIAGVVEADGLSLREWDGVTWGRTLGHFPNFASGDFPLQIQQMVDTPIGLIVLGRFLSVNGISSPQIARWDGEVWHAMSAGSMGTPHGVAYWEGAAYLQDSGALRRWTGSVWSEVLPLSHSWESGRLLVFENHLHRLGGSGVQRLNGSSWLRLGSGQVRAEVALVSEDDLWIGWSSLSQSDGQLTPYLSRWSRVFNEPRAVIGSGGLRAREGRSIVLPIIQSGGTGPIVATRWFHNGQQIDPGVGPGGTRYSPSGVSLVLSQLGRASAGRYSAEVANGCTTAATSDLVLDVVCRGDFDLDGEVTWIDLIQYLRSYFRGEATANEDGYGQVDTADLLLFIESYIRGCP